MRRGQCGGRTESESAVGSDLLGTLEEVCGTCPPQREAGCLSAHFHPSLVERNPWVLKPWQFWAVLLMAGQVPRTLESSQVAKQ